MGADEFLAMLERPHFLKVRSGKITVWVICYTRENSIEKVKRKKFVLFQLSDLE